MRRTRFVVFGGVVSLSMLFGCSLPTDPLKQLAPAPVAPGPPTVVVRTFEDHRPGVGGTREIGARKNFLLFNWKEFRYEAPEPPGLLLARAFARGLAERGVPATCEGDPKAPLELHGRIEEFVADVVGRYGIRISGDAELVDTTLTPAGVLARAAFREELFQLLAMTSAWGSVPVMEKMFAEVLPRVVASVLDTPAFRDALAKRQRAELPLP